MGMKSSARFEVFLDGVSCGSRLLYGREEWVKVGSQVEAGGGEHIAVVVVVADAGGVMGRGIGVGVDSVWVGPHC